MTDPTGDLVRYEVRHRIAVITRAAPFLSRLTRPAPFLARLAGERAIFERMRRP
ncbi:hypothetical protein ABT121_30105 [Streptomyces sp. NPDC001928]|uniref:hypothetical protein n=1 Tax=Streptomyces sp. NPDC001928 TaxID=3154404 RepID=UPI003331D1D6